ncbi:MAG: DEAD/DEAH box helicase [Deltaproteobacteria bacterium]|nr:DEAD/DEAH box helicase [Deltaproteobacteria bacterium]
MSNEFSNGLQVFHPAVRDWFTRSFAAPTRAQTLGWPAIAAGQWTLIFAPTGSGKTLTAFLWALDRLMFTPRPAKERRCRVIYVSPLKALAIDVERNLRAPLAGIANVATERGDAFTIPQIAIRTGDTPQSERARFLRDPADILITTPESLYLMMTSNARDVLQGTETIIIDEIHALVPNKRGAHMMLSIERLALRCTKPPQRLGLSATQRPLDEVSRFLAGPTRPVTIIDTQEKKKLSLQVEVPIEDMARLAEATLVSGPAAAGPRSPSLWPAIHPRLLELIRAHTSTLIFVNSRRLAERLATALNELAGEPLVQAHHGSIARAQRVLIEDALKSGRLPALVATSSLELGIDMGAIDLVIQIEAPPSIASGLQRIGRASHQVGARSEGILVPKFRGDLVACAAVVEAMREGAIEPTRYLRNPLDVLAQQLVAMVAMDPWSVDALFEAVRATAPYADLSRGSFDGVLDMLSGLYPSDEFAELRPRVTWDRVAGTLTARQSAKRVAIISGGTIPDRGLYGVFLMGAEKRSQARVGELDEEMVFESSPGDTFMLGASTWRIEEITHDRVMVTPAPGQPGKMPFWKADAADRSVPFGEAIGKLVREIGEAAPEAALARLTTRHNLDIKAAHNFLQYLRDQVEATGVVPDDRTIVIERVKDDLGDWRVCVLSPWGGKVHAPWAMAVTAKVRNELQIEVETMWSDDGFIVRFPDTENAPAADLLLPTSDEVEGLVLRQLGASALFAAKFREAAARALLLPRVRIAGRTPLWQQRKKAYDLLQVASRFGSFPILLEAYRETLRDVFDVQALVELTKKIGARVIRVHTVDTQKPSPFASSVLFRYVANFLYDGDAPLAERRAQTLAIDQSQLRELLGEPELRELLDADSLTQTELELQHLAEGRKITSADGLHDLLIRLGDLNASELRARSSVDVSPWLAELQKQRRIIEVTVAAQPRFIAVEDASRYRDALGTPLPPGLADRYLQSVDDPVADLVLRFARTHGPFTAQDLSSRYGLGVAVATLTLKRLAERGRVLEGEFRPTGTQREWCEQDVLRTIRRRSLAKLRKEAEPVDPPALARLYASWQGVTRKRRGLDALLEVIESLQGTPMAASIFEQDILAARLIDYRPSDLDTLSAAGEIVWVGVEPLGNNDGRIALYLTDHLPALSQPQAAEDAPLLTHLRARGASFFSDMQYELGGFPGKLVDVLWDLVWKGLVTNDTFHSLRAFTKPKLPQRTAPRFRSRRVAAPSTEGRWSLVPRTQVTDTQRCKALAQQLLARYGLVTREGAAAENLVGGFSAIYPVLKAMEEAGKVRRGYFVTGLGALQFATGGAIDLLRVLKDEPEKPETLILAATDPANPYGAVLPWPSSMFSLSRSVGAHVILVNGVMTCYVPRGEKQLYVFLPEDDPQRTVAAREVANTLAALVKQGHRRALLIALVNDESVGRSPLAPFLAQAGFVPTAVGYQIRVTNA